MPKHIVHFLQTFGRLHILRRVSSVTGEMRVECVCDCGTVKEIDLHNLRAGRIVSCGCYRNQRLSAMTFKHGETNSAEFGALHQAIARCHGPGNNPGYDSYGGRGIKVCERWRNSFADFLSDMGRRPSPKHSLDRWPDLNGNYEPGNCRWATRIEQARNRRSSVFIEYKGKRRSLLELCEEFGVRYPTAKNRLKSGWSEEDLFLPTRNVRYSHFGAPVILVNDATDRDYSDLEKKLLTVLAGMVAQNCTQRMGVYETGWVGVHKEAMILLVEHGIMEDPRDGYARGYWAKFSKVTPWGTSQISAEVPTTTEIKETGGGADTL